MSGSLELGKLVATVFLHRFWHKTASVLKMYLLIAIILLMGITSMGTFGFLSAAFQNNAAAFENVNNQVLLAEQQEQATVTQVEQYQGRIKALNETRMQQEKNLSTVTSNATAKYKLVYQDVERSGKEIDEIQKKIETLQLTLTQRGEEVSILKATALSAGDIGAFKFIAENFNVSVNTVVKWFIILIVLVFDPLAVALVLAYNTIHIKKDLIITKPLSSSKLNKVDNTFVPSETLEQEIKEEEVKEQAVEEEANDEQAVEEVKEEVISAPRHSGAIRSSISGSTLKFSARK